MMEVFDGGLPQAQVVARSRAELGSHVVQVGFGAAVHDEFVGHMSQIYAHNCERVPKITQIIITEAIFRLKLGNRGDRYGSYFVRAITKFSQKLSELWQIRFIGTNIVLFACCLCALWNWKS